MRLFHQLVYIMEVTDDRMVDPPRRGDASGDGSPISLPVLGL